MFIQINMRTTLLGLIVALGSLVSHGGCGSLGREGVPGCSVCGDPVTRIDAAGRVEVLERWRHVHDPVDPPRQAEEDPAAPEGAESRATIAPEITQAAPPPPSAHIAARSRAGP